ncbi:MAG: hypothetical protein AABY28_04180 [Candidatus Omnitrophota bacterium]
MPPKRNYGIFIFGLIEIGIGLITFFVVIASLILGKSTKPLEVVIFVLTTAAISFSLGLGVLRMNLRSYHLLLFFATVVILSKALIFAKIISLSGALEASIPSQAKNTISILYHILLVGYFISPKVRKAFGEKKFCFP